MAVIPFDHKERLAAQAAMYIQDPGLVLQDRGKAVSILLRALRLADPELRHNILFLLNTFAKEELWAPLYDIMSDTEEPEELRDQAAIHLSIIGGFLDDPQPLIRKLVADLKSEHTDVRVRAILAMGWDGNIAVVLPLIETLYDPDHEVHEAAVTALCNIQDSRILNLLTDRMARGSRDQKRAILFNLWRFTDRQDEVTALYKSELLGADPSLRFEILVLLGELEEQSRHESLYRSLLRDQDPRIRVVAIERLALLNKMTAEDLEPFLHDPNMEVKRIALRLIQNHKKNGS